MPVSLSDLITSEFNQLTQSIHSIQSLYRAAYITAAYCALTQELQKYGAYMSLTEDQYCSDSIKKAAKTKEIHLLAFAERAVSDFNRGRFNPPLHSMKKPKGFKQLTV